MIRRRAIGAATAVVLVGACLTSPAQAAPSQPENVIVLLRDQHPHVSARSAATRTKVTDADQAPLIKKARAAHATDVRSLHVINAFAVKASPAEVTRLAAEAALA